MGSYIIYILKTILFKFRLDDPVSKNTIEIVMERLAQSLHAAIISDTICGNKRKTNNMYTYMCMFLI